MTTHYKMTDQDWADLDAAFRPKPTPTTRSTTVPTAQAAPAPTTAPTRDLEIPTPTVRTADEIVAAQKLMPANSAEEMRQIEAFLTAPDPLPTPQRVRIAPKGASKNPTRDAIERLADQVYEVHVLLAEMHKRICARDDQPSKRVTPPGPLDGCEP